MKGLGISPKEVGVSTFGPPRPLSQSSNYVSKGLRGTIVRVRGEGGAVGLTLPAKMK